jgi:hypothetical protein
MQMGAISPNNPKIELGDDRAAVRRFPTLASIKRHLRVQNQVLNHDLIVAPVAGAHRRLHLQHDRFIDLQFIESAAAPPNRLLALAAPFNAAPIRRLIHARGLLRRTRWQMLQARQLVLDRLVLNLQFCQCTVELLILGSKALHLADQLTNQTHQFRMSQAI